MKAETVACQARTIAKLRARVSELEAQNDELRTEHASLSQHFIEDQNELARFKSAESAREGAWVPVASGDKPAMGALVAVDVPEMGVAVGVVKPHWRSADDRQVASDEGYVYELSKCSRFCVLPAPPDAVKETT